MDRDDTRKVAKREIAKELGGRPFVMGIRKIARNRPDKQDILAEYALSSDVQPYLSLMNECGIKPEIVTTSLEGISNLFTRIRPQTEGKEAVLELGRSFIEIMVFNSNVLTNYKKIQMPAVDAEKLTNKDMDQTQICKIKMYTIIDALYNFFMDEGSSAADKKLSRVWIGGLGSVEEGVTECISESLGVSSSILKPFDTAIVNAGIYTSLSGLSSLTKTDDLINLVPYTDRDGKHRSVRRMVLTAALSCYVMMILGGYTVLNRMEQDLKVMQEKAREESIRLSMKQEPDTLDETLQDAHRIYHGKRFLYGIFRDIANLTPSDISLTDLEFEKAGEVTFLRITAVIRSGEEGLRSGVLSRFQNALEGTSRLKAVSSPEVSTSSDRKKRVLTVKTRYEVLP
jgi:hypothetical protein